MNTLLRAAGLALLCTGAAQAATVNLTYTGTSWMENNVAVTGSGQFVTKANKDIGTIGVADLASFNFTFSFAYQGASDTFSYDLSDLSCTSPFYSCDFSATLTGAGVTDLMFQTVEKAALQNWAQGVHVKSLATDDVYTGNFDMPPLSNGTMTADLAQDPGHLPEPASWALGGLALAAASVGSRRRAR